MTEQEMIVHKLSVLEEKIVFMIMGMQKMTKVILNIDASMDFLMEEKKAE
jgi:hypothetical protein